MVNINRRAQFNIKDLLFIITEIEHYPEFIPWCKVIDIIHKDHDRIVADVQAGFGMIRAAYRSEVVIEDCTGESRQHSGINRYASVTAKANEGGPFEYMETRWILNELDDNLTEINFWMNFKFKSVIKQKMANLFLKDITTLTIDAFLNRTEQLLAKK